MKSNNALHSFLDWTVKLTSVVLTVPVTWTVARTLFTDIGEPFRTLMQIAAVVLVDGLLLRDWTLLDSDLDATTERKARYAATVLIVYVGLMVLAIQHGEGAAGLVFRAAIGIGIVSSVLSSFGETLRKNLDKAKHGVRADWRVQMYARRLSRRDARLTRKSESVVHAARVQAEQQVSIKKIDVDSAEQLDKLDSGHKSVQSDSVQKPTVRSDRKPRSKKQQVIALHRSNPDMPKAQIADEVGVSRTTVYKWWPEVLRENGGTTSK